MVDMKTATTVAIVLSLIACKGLPRKADAGPTEEDQAAAIAAAHADAEAHAAAELEARFRTDCKVKAPVPVFPVYDEDLREACRDRVRVSLKVPGSGHFPSPREEAAQLQSDDGCRRIYRSFVDAKNAFGVEVRTPFACTYDPRTGLYSVK